MYYCDRNPEVPAACPALYHHISDPDISSGDRRINLTESWVDGALAFRYY